MYLTISAAPAICPEAWGCAGHPRDGPKTGKMLKIIFEDWGLILRVCSYTALFLVIATGVRAEELPFEPTAIIEDYVAVSNAQRSRLQGASMEVDIEADLPTLHKSGRLHALRRISGLGRITYELLRFEGDRSIKNEVIARYLTAESESVKSESAALAVTPANYKFKYKGLIVTEGRKVHAFHVTPRKKKIGLYVGELWVDSDTHLAVREAGRFVKSPSIFLKKVEFVKDYQIQNGVAVPSRIKTTVETRVVGKAHLSVAFSSVSLTDGIQPASDGDSE